MFLSPKALAAETGLSLSAIYLLVQSRRLAVVRSSKQGRILIAREDWDAYLAAHRIPARGERETPKALSRERLIAAMDGADRYVS